MMIEAKLYFENGVNPGGVVEDLQSLPEPFKPVYFAEDEGRIIQTNLLLDNALFQNFLKQNPIGFFLYTKNKTLINVSISRTGYSEVTLWLKTSKTNMLGELVHTFFKSLARHKPVFGFACDVGEYDHRNRHYITFGINHVEAWIGRRLEKYISGVYWYTLFSDGLLAKHGVKLVNLMAEALTSETLGDGSLHLLNFFENPKDWNENAERLDDLCEQTNGVFSRRLVERAVAGITTRREYDKVLGQWP